MTTLYRLLCLALFATTLNACQNNESPTLEDLPVIKGEDLLKEMSRSLSINFSAIQSMKVLNDVELKKIEPRTLILEGRESLSHKDQGTLQDIIQEISEEEEGEDLTSELDVDLMKINSIESSNYSTFSIETKAVQIVSFKLFNEEGFELVESEGKIELSEGLNYFNMNMKPLGFGEYILLLENNTNEKMIRKFTVNQ